jgi:hypothetical protein
MTTTASAWCGSSEAQFHTAYYANPVSASRPIPAWIQKQTVYKYVAATAMGAG